MDDEGDWISTEEAAELTGYSVIYIRELLNKGKLKGRKFGILWMVDREFAMEFTKQAIEKRKEDKRYGPEA